jgi:hypothetical protein
VLDENVGVQGETNAEPIGSEEVAPKSNKCVAACTRRSNTSVLRCQYEQQPVQKMARQARLHVRARQGRPPLGQAERAQDDPADARWRQQLGTGLINAIKKDLGL